MPVSEGEDHPVVEVNWDEAKAFCSWLAAKDKLPYRLPTDHEWSCAVGIGDREQFDAQPSDKSWLIKGVYPWGTAWPPPEKVGNLANFTCYNKSEPSWPVVGGHHDEFATTSPVMSFPPNQFGLYDLAGNVMEWCEDWTDKKQDRRVLRGSSWIDRDQEDLESAVRAFCPPHERGGATGFRVVLEVEKLEMLN